MTHYMNVSELIKFSQKTSVFTLIIGEAILIHITTYDFMEKYQNFSLYII